MFDRTTDECKRVIAAARHACDTTGADALDDLHLLLDCCEVADSLGARLIVACGGDPRTVVEQVQGVLPDRSSAARKFDAPSFTHAAKRVLEASVDEAATTRRIGSHHLVLAMLRAGGTAADSLTGCGVTLSRACEVADELNESEATQLCPPGVNAYARALIERVFGARPRS